MTLQYIVGASSKTLSARAARPCNAVYLKQTLPLLGFETETLRCEMHPNWTLVTYLLDLMIFLQ